MVKKQILFFALIIVAVNNLHASFFAKEDTANFSSFFNIGGDGAEGRKNKEGDRAKNQGYATYKRWSLGIMINAYSAPSQDGDSSAGVGGMSAIVEHNISEFLNVGVTYVDQKFDHLDDDQEGSISHKHFVAYAGWRKWVTQNVLINSNLGLSSSKMSFMDKEYKGTGTSVSVGVDYAIDDSDSSRVGYKYFSIVGKDNTKTKNIGMSAHCIAFKINF
jgi:hypothetical protein